MSKKLLILSAVILVSTIQGCGDISKDPCDTAGVACHNKCYFVEKTFVNSDGTTTDACTGIGSYREPNAIQPNGEPYKGN